MRERVPFFPLTPALEYRLRAYREVRAFIPAFYLRAKLALLSQYFIRTNITAVVVGVSGGLDSAVTLAMLKTLCNQDRSPLKKIVPICLPCYPCQGASGQRIATMRAKRVINYFDLEAIVLNLGPMHRALYEGIADSLALPHTPWSQGQLVSNLRTPVLYQVANQLHESGYPCVVIGTINRDEGGYIGFFGKASDAMVDIQLISDLHKSEVRSLAHYLTIPTEIIDAVPTGNTYDGKNDETSFEFSYDFLELYAHYRNLIDAEQAQFMASLDTQSMHVFKHYERSLLKRHKRNQHKYSVPPQGLHFDVYQKTVRGGWQHHAHEKKALDLTLFQNLFVLDTHFFTACWTYTDVNPIIQHQLPYVDEIEHAFTESEISGLLAVFKQQKKSYAGINGYPSASGLQLRATTHSTTLAALLFQRLKHGLYSVMSDDGFQPIDGGKNTLWRLKGISPVFRFIAYEPGGELIAHYDAGYEDGQEKTLFSLVFYLTTQPHAAGGQTVILLDTDRNQLLSERLFVDDATPILPAQVLYASTPKAGNGLMLAHRIKHAVIQNQSNEQRIVLRADIVYERIGPDYEDNLIKKNSSFAPVTDLFYLPYYMQTQSMEKLVQAGFIAQASVTQEKTNWSILPLMKLFKVLNQLNLTDMCPSTHQHELVVLLTTGGFCPLHTEHLMLMTKAKQALEREGKTVIAGFFSPSHVEHIKTKSFTEQYCSRQHLNWLCHSVADSTWLDLWLWEYLENNQLINFTDVILKLEAELAMHIKTTLPIKVAYAFGSDNAAFAYAFLDRGLALCLSRPGFHEQWSQVKSDPVLIGKHNIYFIESDNPSPLASTSLRAECGFIPQLACHTVHLRDDALGYQLWEKNHSHVDFHSKNRVFLKQLVELIYATYTPYAFDFSVQIHSAREQVESLKQRLIHKTVLSLDPCYVADFNLGVSRYFRFGIPEMALGFCARPESAALEIQLSQLPQQAYCLVDDDTYSGKTLNFVKQLLMQNHSVTETQVSVACSGLECGTEILDLRDFLVGAYHGGLVVLLPNQKLARVPYMYPYVLPSQRYYCPAEANISFSYAVWRLNQAYFAELAEPLLIKACDLPFINLAEYLGFSKEDTLLDFCNVHLDEFNRLRSFVS